MIQVTADELVRLFNRLPDDEQEEVLAKVRRLVADSIPDQALSLSEIQPRYPDQWVLLDEINQGAGPRPKGGWVRRVGHDKGALYREAQELGCQSVAILFMGEIKPAAEFVAPFGVK